MTIDLLKKSEFLRHPARYKVMHGGRGGGKSYAVVGALLLVAMKETHRILCTREFQVSIADSVHRTIADLIDEYRLGWFFDVQRSRIVGRNGSEFIFAGLARNVTNVKSMKGITIAWVEEAEAVSEYSWSILIPTIREPGSEIWVTFNPDMETDATYRRFIADPPPDAVVVRVGWRDNPWFPEELRKHKDHMYAVDPDAAEHVYGGKTRTISKALVLHGKVSVEPFVPGDEWDGPYQGADWGFANDPTALVRMWITEDAKGEDDELPARTLWVEHEAYGVGVEITDTPALFDVVPGVRECVTRADNARPETISHMQRNGYPLIKACEKGPGSVEDGVAHLRSFSRIVIHPRCKNAIDESRHWSYKKNKGGDVLPVLADGNDNAWDAARYALEPVMKRRKFSYDGYKSAGKRREASGVTKRGGGGFRSRPGGIL